MNEIHLYLAWYANSLFFVIDKTFPRHVQFLFGPFSIVHLKSLRLIIWKSLSLFSSFAYSLAIRALFFWKISFVSAMPVSRLLPFQAFSRFVLFVKNIWVWSFLFRHWGTVKPTGTPVSRARPFLLMWVVFWFCNLCLALGHSNFSVSLFSFLSVCYYHHLLKFDSWIIGPWMYSLCNICWRKTVYYYYHFVFVFHAPSWLLLHHQLNQSARLRTSKAPSVSKSLLLFCSF